MGRKGRLPLVFARCLVATLTAPWLRWFWDLRIFPNQLDRAWGIPYHRFVLRFFHKLRTCSRHFPKCRSLWVVGSNQGRAFTGNSAFLFLHQAAQKCNPALMVWITHNRKVLKDLRKHGYSTLNGQSIGGSLACLVAKVHIISHNQLDTNLWVSEGAHRVQLWHGLPIKKLYWDVEGQESGTWQFLHNWHGRTERFWRFRTPWNFGYGEHAAYASIGSVFRDRLVGAFHGNPATFHNLGFARNDYILDPNPAFEWMLGEHLATWKTLRQRASKVVLYLPTWRELSSEAATERPVFKDWERLNAFLEARNMILLHKGHDSNQETRIIPPTCGNIFVIPGDIDSTYLMAGADAVVTDYSSIYVDFLVTDRPIAFFWFDEDFYTSREHELYTDMLEHLPGPVLRSVEDWESFLERLHHGEEDIWAAKRKAEYDRLFNIQGGGSCDRILAFLKSGLKSD